MVETLLFLFIVLVKEGMVEIPNWNQISEISRVWGLGIELVSQGIQIN